MTNETMTVHKALSELKIIGDRIEKAIHTSDFCEPSKQSNQKIKGVHKEEYIKQMLGNWDKVNDLIKRRNSLKKAVVLSNANTIVKINNEEYTVAEAIEMKNTGMEYKRDLMEILNSQYSEAKKIADIENDKIEEKSENYVFGLFGQKEGKTSNDEIEKIKKEYIKSNTVAIVDPINIKEKINNLEKEISEFETEVDAALSTSNSLTEITIKY